LATPLLRLTPKTLSRLEPNLSNGGVAHVRDLVGGGNIQVITIITQVCRMFCLYFSSPLLSFLYDTCPSSSTSLRLQNVEWARFDVRKVKISLGDCVFMIIRSN
jgi:hypothetical protein